MNIEGMNVIQSRYKSYINPTCPICDQYVEMCAYMISFNELGQVDSLYHSINLLDKGLKEVGTHTHLRKYMLQCAKGRGECSMTDVLHGTGSRYSRLAASRDLIGWRRFM